MIPLIQTTLFFIFNLFLIASLLFYEKQIISMNKKWASILWTIGLYGIIILTIVSFMYFIYSQTD